MEYMEQGYLILHNKIINEICIQHQKSWVPFCLICLYQAQCSSGPDLGPNFKDHQQTTKFAAGRVLTRILKIKVKLLFARLI